MDTVFSVHHDSKVIRERNRLLKLQHGSVDDLASSLNSFDRPPSQDKRPALHSLLSSRFGLSPAGTPQPSPPTSRASTPSNEVTESSLYANAFTHTQTNSVNTNASTTHPSNQSSIQPLVPAPSSLSSSPRLLPIMTPRAFQNMRKVVPVLEGDDIWNLMNNRPSTPWLSIGKVEDGNGFNGNGGGLHGEKKE
ncbi:9838_t:CDS:2 [Paraglomus brasilianum]|uniref:9838_t:CDS:1 n=1 Tax=Paraglomus brasilianum TaxID=144538 RepID=A0A9N9BU24_9GLOM|nr:9838_t:CDS:2 [Paraglomus brasilianum]